MRSCAVVTVVLWALAVVCADSGPIGEAVICRGVGPKGQPVSPASWFPAGTTSLTLWFRARDLPTATLRGEVRWLLGNTTLATREVAVPSGGTASSTYSLALDEPLPSGTYQAVLSVGGRAETKVVVRVGGKAPERSAVKAVIPEHERPAPGGGLRRSARTPDVGGAPSPPRIGPGAARAEPGSEATGVSVPALPPAVGSQTAVQPDPAAGAAHVTAPEVPPSVARSDGAEDPRAATEAVSTAPDDPATGPPAPLEPPTTPWSATPVGPPETIRIATVDDTGPRTPVVPQPPPAVKQADEGRAAAATGAEDDRVPTGPPSTPLGPRTAGDGGARPLVDRSRLPQGGAGEDESAAATRSAPSSAPAPLLRTRGAAAAVPGGPAKEPAVPRPALRSASRVPPAAPPGGAEQAAPETLTPPGAPDDGRTDEVGRAGSGPPAMAAPDELPSPAATQGDPAQGTPATEVAPPGATPAEGTTPSEPDPAAGGETAAPVTAGPSAAATADDPTRTAESPPGETTGLPPMPDITQFEGPLVTDAIAEDLPPLELSEQAVELHRVELVVPDDPIRRPGIEPYFVMRVPDGRLWPPSLPHQFPLYAGPNPSPNPEDLFLYSDHIDGIVPLYEVPIAEAGLHMAKENQAGLLSVSREMYDERRVAWQTRATTWQWLWYIRDIDLSRGDAVTGYLTDVNRSRRVPEDFQPGVGEALILLDEQGQRVQPTAFDERSTQALVEALGDRLAGVNTSDPEALSGEVRRKGLMALSLWRAPKTGRYQLWAALPLDACQAQSLVWVSRAGQ